MKITKSSALFIVLLIVFVAGSVIGRKSAIGTQAVIKAVELGASKAADVPVQTPALLAGVPDVRQSTGFSCGAAALQAVLAHWGIHEREDRLIARLRSTPEKGTHPDDIVRGAREFGLKGRNSSTGGTITRGIRPSTPGTGSTSTWPSSSKATAREPSPLSSP